MGMKRRSYLTRHQSMCVGCIVLYSGQGKFHATSTTRTLHYIVDQAHFTVENMNNVSQYMNEGKNIGVEQLTMPENIQNQINAVQAKIDTASDTLSDKTQDNSRKIRRVLDSVRLSLIVLAAVMLLLAFVGFMLSNFWSAISCVYIGDPWLASGHTDIHPVRSIFASA